jgi:hypothetical protein
LTLMDSSIVPRAFSSAQRTIQSFSSSQHFPALSPKSEFHSASGTVRAEPHCQRTSFEGTKKPIGCFAPRSTFVSRPPSVVAAREASPTDPRTSTHFVIFFPLFCQFPSKPYITNWHTIH